MRKETIKSLKRKGWNEEDIENAEKIIESRKSKDKSRTFAYSSRVVYWTVIALMVIGNFAISLMLIPFLLVLNKLTMNIVVVLIGLSFGSFFNLLIMDIEQVSKKQHIIAGVIIPVLALINIAVIVRIANSINEALGISIVREGPITISILYIVAFMLPYLWSIFVKKRIDFGY